MALLKEIREISREAASKLERAGCCTDSDIRTLTHDDLKELLPGLSNFRTRKKIHEAIHKRRPIHDVLNKLKGCVPDEFLRDALSNNEALCEYLQTLKELKVEITHVQEFLDAHIELLEKYGQNQETKSKKGQAFGPSASASSAGFTATTNTNHHMNHVPSQKPPASIYMQYNLQKDQASSLSTYYDLYNSETFRSPQATVVYKLVVSGNTLNSHFDVMEKLKRNAGFSFNLQETKREEDSQVVIVFCPVVSRAGTDVETALQDVSEAKPVILVMMHHSRKAHTPPTVNPCNHNVMLLVSVFFHETVPGLLKCPQNDEAIVSVQNILQMIATGK